MINRNALRTAITTGLANGFASVTSLPDIQYVSMAVLAALAFGPDPALALDCESDEGICGISCPGNCGCRNSTANPSNCSCECEPTTLPADGGVGVSFTGPLTGLRKEIGRLQIGRAHV